jgi:hypothetical protein
MGKAYLVDGTKAGIFPRTPNDPMVKVLPLPDEPKKAYYLDGLGEGQGIHCSRCRSPRAGASPWGPTTRWPDQR